MGKHVLRGHRPFRAFRAIVGLGSFLIAMIAQAQPVPVLPAVPESISWQLAKGMRIESAFRPTINELNQPESEILSALYVQSRFIKILLRGGQLSSEAISQLGNAELATSEVQSAISNSIHFIERWHKQPTETVVIKSVEEWRSVSRRWLAAPLLLKEEVDKVSGLDPNLTLPKRPILKFENAQALEAARQDFARFRTFLNFSLKVSSTWNRIFLGLLNRRWQKSEMNVLSALTADNLEGSVLRDHWKKLKSSEKRGIAEKLSRQILAQVENIRSAGSTMSASLKLDDPLLTHSLQVAVSSYFKHIKTVHAFEILAAIVDTAPDLEASALKGAVVRGSGPRMIKLMQNLYRGLDANSQKSLSFIEQDMTPVPADFIGELVKANGLTGHYTRFQYDAVAAGSLAQVHAAWIGDRKIAVRVLKPGIETINAWEADIFSGVLDDLDADPVLKGSGLPNLRPQLEDVNRMIGEEMNIAQTDIQQRLAAELYDSDIVSDIKIGTDSVPVRFRAVIPEVLDNPSAKFMDQDWVNGRSLEETLATFPELQDFLPDAISKHILRKFFFGTDGRLSIHGDMHLGNLKFRVERTTDGYDIEMIILDYGFFIEIPKVIAQQMLSLFANEFVDHADGVTESLWALRDQHRSTITEQNVRLIVAAHFANNKQKEAIRLLRLMAQLAKSGYVLPYETSALLRSYGAQALAMDKLYPGKVRAPAVLVEELLMEDPSRFMQLGPAAKSILSSKEARQKSTKLLVGQAVAKSKGFFAKLAKRMMGPEVAPSCQDVISSGDQ
jgi:hypothetical protein